MSDGDLVKWIRYLHAAAAVPKDDPDYEEAQAAVAHAKRKIAFINRSANRSDIETPGARETARMAALAGIAGDVAAAPVGPAAAMMGAPPALGGMLEEFISRIAGKKALDLRGVDTDAYERGMEAHPTATAVGEMVPPVLMALAGGVGGRKPAARFTAARVQPAIDEFLTGLTGRGQPSALPRIKADILPGTYGLPPSSVPRIFDPLDVPPLLRRTALPPEEPVVNAASEELRRRLLLGRIGRRRP